jgi:hypothetical protein
MDPAQVQREIALTSLRSGAPVPKIVESITAIPKVEPPKKHLVTTVGPRGEPLRRLATEEELATGVPEYREPEKRASATAGAGQKPGALAEMVRTNPDLLKDLNPTLRGQVLTEIARSGQDMPNQRQEAVSTMVDKALETVAQLTTLPGRAGAVGAPALSDPGSWQRLIGAAPAAGSPAATYTRYIDTLKSQLTLPNLQFLRGLGHMSDREFKAIADSVTALDAAMDEGQFAKELAVIETTLNAVQERSRGGVMRPTTGVQIDASSLPQGAAPTKPSAADLIRKYGGR